MPRELEVLALEATGQSNAEIATSVHVSQNIVKTHVTSWTDIGLRDRVPCRRLRLQDRLRRARRHTMSGTAKPDAAK
jgi:DNA-binding NarL/FixJ family response regulator